jgi:hypothetical protein
MDRLGVGERDCLLRCLYVTGPMSSSPDRGVLAMVVDVPEALVAVGKETVPEVVAVEVEVGQPLSGPP